MRILTVCTGNICRSPYAQIRLQAALDAVRPGGFEVTSAGTHGLAGQGVDPGSVRVLTERGLSGKGFIARVATEQILGEADLILPLELSHRDAILRSTPRQLKRTFTLLELARLVEALGEEQPWTERLSEHSGTEPESVDDRWRAMLQVVAAERGGRVGADGEDNVPDPYRRSDRHFDDMATTIDAAVDRLAGFEREFGSPTSSDGPVDSATMTGMTATILDGKAILVTIRAELAERVSALRARGVTPGLGTVLVGDDPGSHWYVGAKHRDCAEIGITSIRRDLPASASLADVLAVVRELNEDPACTGFIVQQPTGLDENAILSAVDPAKDVDGLHPTNLGWLVLGHEAPLPCTPVGCVELLRRHGVPIAGARVVIVGRGITVGRPLGLILTRKSENATVTLCHTGTQDLAAAVREADIVVAAAGVPNIITPDMVRPGAAVLDVGVSRIVEDGHSRVAGDVHPDVAQVAGFISPNPGGVGPMTRAMLLTNVVAAAERAAGV